MIPKFRVLNKYNKKMYPVLTIDFESKVISMLDHELMDCLEVPLEDEYLIQSTGLVDKNGVEIYEGDVVLMRWSVYDEPTCFVIFKTYTGEWRVDDGVKGTVLGFSHEDVEKVGDVFTGNYKNLRQEWEVRQKQFERFVVGRRMKKKDILAGFRGSKEDNQ